MCNNTAIIIVYKVYICIYIYIQKIVSYQMIFIFIQHCRPGRQATSLVDGNMHHGIRIFLLIVIFQIE